MHKRSWTVCCSAKFSSSKMICQLEVTHLTQIGRRNNEDAGNKREKIDPREYLRADLSFDAGSNGDGSLKVQRDAQHRHTRVSR